MMDEKDRFAELESPESLLYRDLGDFNFLTKRMPSVSFCMAGSLPFCVKWAFCVTS